MGVVYLIEPPVTMTLGWEERHDDDYPDGTVSIKYCGKALTYKVFDKLQLGNQAVIVDNKRLGAALAK